MSMTMDELLAKVPEPFRPVVAKYGPALAGMTAEELWAWIELLVRGRTAQAYEALARRLGDEDLLAAMASNAAAWEQANAANAARLELQREAALAVLRAMLTAALALVGL